MITNKTFAILKPNTVEDGNTGSVLQMIISAGFKIEGMKYLLLSKADAARFYAIHKDRPFFEELVGFMTRSPIVVLVLHKPNAVEAFRKLIGHTDPQKAEEGTIRKRYAKSIGENAIHGSDSDENAAIEIQFFFSERELCPV